MTTSLFQLLRRVLLLAACVVVVGCGLRADAKQDPLGSLDPLVVRQDFWIDASGRSDLATLQDARWQPLQGFQTFGYGPEPVWVRLVLRGGEPGGSPWVVQVRPAFLDQITLHDPAAGLELRAGDYFGLSDDALGSLNFHFELPAMATPREVYLRIESTSVRAFMVSAQPRRAAQSQAQAQEWLLGSVFAVSTLLTLWAFLQSRQGSDRVDRVMLVFGFKQMLTTLWLFFQLGFARVVLGDVTAPGVLSALASGVLPWTIGMTALFLALLLRDYRPPRLLGGTLFGLALVLFALPLLQLFGQIRLSLLLTNSLLILGAVLAVLTLLAARSRQPSPPPIPRGFLLAYLAVNCPLNAVAPAMFLGLLPMHPLGLVVNLTHVVTDALVMWLMLQTRARRLHAQQRRVALSLRISEEQAALEKQQREDLSQLFTMLAHEMKTPLAVLRMGMEAGTLRRETLNQAIDDMNLVIERCVHTGQLADGGLQPVQEATDAIRLTREVIGVCRDPARVDARLPEPGLAVLQADPQMLSIVLGNLLDNACKYGCPSSRIEVTLHASDEEGQAGWRWQVVNRAGAAGLPDAASLFQKYYRSPQARRQSGSGLGLFLIKGLLILMQGRVEYQARGDDAVFSVWLPAPAAPTAS